MTDSDFQSHYADYYTQADDDAFRVWRASGAYEKAVNVVELWSRLGQTSRPKVIDIGCGNGAIAAELSARGFFERLVGYDVSPSGIEQAVALELPQSTFNTVDGDGHLPEPDGGFDLAVLSHVVEHVEEPRRILREASRVAEWVVVEVPLEHNVRHAGDFVWTETGHVNFYDLSLIRQLLQSCRLEVVEERVTTPSLVWAQRTGRHGTVLKWHVKNLALRLAPPVARGVLTYHATLLARSPR